MNITTLIDNLIKGPHRIMDVKFDSSLKTPFSDGRYRDIHYQLDFRKSKEKDCEKQEASLPILDPKEGKLSFRIHHKRRYDMNNKSWPFS